MDTIEKLQRKQKLGECDIVTVWYELCNECIKQGLKEFEWFGNSPEGANQREMVSVDLRHLEKRVLFVNILEPFLGTFFVVDDIFANDTCFVFGNNILPW